LTEASLLEGCLWRFKSRTIIFGSEKYLDIKKYLDINWGLVTFKLLQRCWQLAFYFEISASFASKLS